MNTLKFYDMRGNMNSIIHFNRRFAKHVICKNVYGLHFSQDYIDIEFAPGASHKALRFVNTTKNCPDADFGDTFTRSHAKILDMFTSLPDVSTLQQTKSRLRTKFQSTVAVMVGQNISKEYKFARCCSAI